MQNQDQGNLAGGSNQSCAPRLNLSTDQIKALDTLAIHHGLPTYTAVVKALHDMVEWYGKRNPVTEGFLAPQQQELEVAHSMAVLAKVGEAA